MKNPKIVPSQMRVGFSLKKEVFFVMLASVIGAIFMHAPRIIAGHENFTQYKITLLVIARTVGSESFELGFIIHIGVAVVIGITTGVLLYKVLKFNILYKFVLQIHYICITNMQFLRLKLIQCVLTKHATFIICY